MPLMMQRAAIFFCMFMALGKVCWKFSTFDTAVGKFALEIQRGRIRLSLMIYEICRKQLTVLAPLLATASIKKSFFALRLPHKKHIKIFFSLKT